MTIPIPANEIVVAPADFAQQLTDRLVQENERVANQLVNSTRELAQELVRNNERVADRLAEHNANLARDLAETNREIADRLVVSTSEVAIRLLVQNQEIAKQIEATTNVRFIKQQRWNWSMIATNMLIAFILVFFTISFFRYAINAFYGA